MRVALLSVLVVLLCCAGYGVAFQQPAVERLPAAAARIRAEAVRESPPALPPRERFADVGHPVIAPETYSLYGNAPNGQPVAAAPQSQQLAVVISTAGLRFLSTRAGLDILDDAELQADGLLVLCDSADVTTDAEGTQEVVCHVAAVIKAAGMGGKAGQLRYKAGSLVLEGDDADALITRNKGDKTVFMLRAKTINVNLNTQQIEASDGSVIQLKPEAKPAPVVD
jgi:hypothetical protein